MKTETKKYDIMSKSIPQMTRNREVESPLYRFPATAGPVAPGEVDGDIFLRRIVDACAAGVAVLDELGTVLYVSPAWGPLAEPDGPTDLKHLKSIYLGIRNPSGGGANALAEDVQRILEGREREFHKEYSVAGNDGPMWFLMHAARLDLPGTNRFRVLVTREDVTRHKQAEKALQTLGGRLINAQEEERSRVARELHDDLNQQVAIMSIELEQLGRKIPESRQDLGALVSELWAKAQEISSEIHRLSYELHPAKLDHLGLAAAIKSLCDELSKRREIKIEFRQQGFPAVLSREVTLCVFRIAQESLHNMARHSGAHESQVLLRKSADSVHLHVSDTGCGFDMQSSRSKNGLGFISMRERLRLVGGRISIRSQPFTGTQVDIVVPI
ncbi:MAG: ATP-binding protein [Acidobacteriota bacterium]